MIAFTSIEYDENGSVFLYDCELEEVRNTTRRVSRTKTLDGGCVIVDGGYSDSDRTFKVFHRYDEQKYAVLEHLHKEYTLIYITTREGYFTGVISAVTLSGDNPLLVKLTVLIKDKLSA